MTVYGQILCICLHTNGGRENKNKGFLVFIHISIFGAFFSGKKVSHYTWVNTVNIFIVCILVFSQGSKLLVSLTFYVFFKIATTEKFHFFAKSFIQVIGTVLVIQQCDSKREKLLLSSWAIFFISPVLKLKQMGSVMWILIAMIIRKKQLSTYNNITELKLIVDLFFQWMGEYLCSQNMKYKQINLN